MNKSRVIPLQIANALSKFSPHGNLVVEITEVAGFPPLSKKQHYGFDYLHNYLYFPQPQWLTDLRSDKKGQRWYLRFVGGLYDGVQGARLAVGYHLGNIQNIEQAVRDVIARKDFPLMAPGSVVAVGSTQKLEFEYHAYILAYRRTLEYLARAIAGYFKSDCSSFRNLPNVLGRDRRISSQRVREVYQKYRPSFSFVVSEGDGHMSLRDILCHHEFLSAGTYNLTSDGLRFLGGAEALGSDTESDQLSVILANKISLLDAFLTEMLCELTDGIREEHSKS